MQGLDMGGLLEDAAMRPRVQTAMQETVRNQISEAAVDVDLRMGADGRTYVTIHPGPDADALMIYEKLHDVPINDAKHLDSVRPTMVAEIKRNIAAIVGIDSYTVPGQVLTCTVLNRKIHRTTITSTTVTTTSGADFDTIGQSDNETESDSASQIFTTSSMLTCIALLLARS